MAVMFSDEGDGGRKRTDKEWVAAALRDMRAFAPLYAHYYLPIYQYCRIRLQSAQEAEDATSEIFERAMRSLLSFRGESFRSWLFTIAANHVRNVARDRKPTSPLPPDTERRDLDPAISPEEAAISGEQAALIQGYLAQLPSGQRSVAELRLVGHSTKEIAEVLGLSLHAVKVTQWRAFKRLRTLVDGAERIVGTSEKSDD
jgi:RNA polymerase sigma-70 factor (ECF subfamily)